MVVAARGEVGRQVLVRVAVAVGAGDPDLLAAELVAQGLERADLVGDPVDARPALRVGVHHGVAPERAHDALDRHVLVGRDMAQPGAGVAPHQGERLDHRPVRLVVGAEVKASSRSRHHPAVVAAVGAADRGAQAWCGTSGR